MNTYVLEMFATPKGRPTYDMYYGFVIVAESEERARELAGEKAEELEYWKTPEFVSCSIIDASREGIILSDFLAG